MFYDVKWHPKGPPPARNLPRDETESGIRKSSWCNGAPPCLLHLSGAPAVNLSRVSVVLVVQRLISRVVRAPVVLR